MKHLSFFLSMFIFLLFSCEDDLSTPTDLIGEWDWIISTGGIGGFSYTPESTGNRIKLEFTSDSIFRRYVNDTLNIESRFNIIDTSLYNEPVKIIVYERIAIRQYYELKKSDTLLLVDFGADGFFNTYSRIK